MNVKSSIMSLEKTILLKCICRIFSAGLLLVTEIEKIDENNHVMHETPKDLSK